MVTGQLIGLPRRPLVRAALAAMGVKICKHHGSDEPRLFIADEAVRRQLLGDTRWAQSRIDQILSRLTGAQRDQKRLDDTVEYERGRSSN